MTPRERVLARLALGLDVASPHRTAADGGDLEAADVRDEVIMRLGAMLALDAGPTSLVLAVGDAERAGVSQDEIVSCLVSLVPTIGSARTSAVAPALALAMGFDVDAALEQR